MGMRTRVESAGGMCAVNPASAPHDQELYFSLRTKSRYR